MGACACGRGRTKQGGALLLGSAIWINGSFPGRGPYCAGWNLVENDLSRTAQEGGPYPLCFNVNSKTFGSFAVLYHSSMFRSVIDWLDNDANMAPFDHMFPDLSQAGHIVRVAHPPIAIQEVGHTSSIDASRNMQHDMAWRSQLHRWGDLSLYCDPATGQAFRLDSD